MSKSPASPTLDGLLDLACRDGVDVRPTLLRVLTDLYVQKAAHTNYEEIQYVELALGLIRTVDPATRAAVAASLRDYPAAPHAVLEALGVASATPAPAPSPEATPNELVDLFFTGSPSERGLILANLDVVSPLRMRPLTAAHQTVADLELAALQRDPSAFAHILERDLGLARALADRIAHDDFGESIVVVAKAIGMKAAVLQRILLFLNPRIGRSVERVYNLASLFDELPAQTAAHLLASWSIPVPRKQPVHAPQFYDDERRRARPASQTGRAGERPVQPAHVKTNRR